MRLVLNIVLSVLIPLGGAFSTWLIHETEPEAQQLDAVAESAMLVETARVEFGSFRPTIRALGTVRAEQELDLSARVSGYVTDVGDGFEPGALVSQGDVLVALDRDDFRSVIDLREAEVTEAEAAVRIEEGQQEIARSDLDRFARTDELGGIPDDGDLALMLREPQAASAEARLDAAEASLRRARRDLGRTRVEAPWPALVVSRDVQVGAQISAGEPLGRLVGTAGFWVVATVPAADLRWLVFDGETRSSGSRPSESDDDDQPDETGPSHSPPNATVVDRAAWPDGVSREAHLLRPLGALEEGTRLARILLEVRDPLGREPSNADAEPLLLGAFVEVTMRARPIEDVVRVRRELVREGDTVWVMEDDVLRIRPLTIVFRDPAYAYVSEGLSASDQVVVTNLSTVVDGAALRLASSDASAPTEGTGEGRTR